jgi:hypothetical protein
VRLHIFQRSLTKDVAKWYIELKGSSFKSLNDLGMMLLTHYQLPIRYEIGMKLLNLLHHDTTTHIYDHIHEWRRRQRMIKTQILDKLLIEWFIKSLPSISMDVAMVGEATKEKTILHA